MPKQKSERLTGDEVRLIKGLLVAGNKVKEIAKVFGVTAKTITRIRHAHTYSHVRPLQANRVPTLDEVAERRDLRRYDRATLDSVDPRFGKAGKKIQGLV